MNGTLWEKRGMKKRHIEECGSVWLWIRAWGRALSEYISKAAGLVMRQRNGRKIRIIKRRRII